MMTPPVKRLALVGPLPPPYGGMANQTALLAEYLRSEGVVVDVIQTNCPYWPAWVGGIPVIRAFFRLIPYLGALWHAGGRNRLFHIMANSGWSWHLFAAPAIWIASLRGCAIVLNYRGGEAESFFRRSFRWVAPSLRRCHRIIVPSPFLKEVFSRFGQAAEIVPNPVQLERFQRSPQRSIENQNGPCLVVCRNLEAIYGIDDVLKAFSLICRHFPKARLWVAGSGPEAARLKKLAQELEIEKQVTFTGRLSPDGIARLLAQADVLLNASRVDNSPNAFLEAMAVGVPIVSTDAGGIPYLVEDGRTALLVPVGDHEALAAAAIRVLADPRLRNRLAQEGRKETARYEWPQVKKHLFEQYRLALQAVKRERCQ